MEIQVGIGYSSVIGPKMESTTIEMRWNHGKREGYLIGMI